MVTNKLVSKVPARGLPKFTPGPILPLVTSERGALITPLPPSVYIMFHVLTLPSVYILYLNLCSIHGLCSNFHYLGRHLSSSKAHLLVLNETHVSTATSSNPYYVPSYFLYSQFRSKAGAASMYAAASPALVPMILTLQNFLPSDFDLTVIHCIPMT